MPKESAEITSIHGRLIGSYNAIWLGGEAAGAIGSGAGRDETIRKLNASIGQKIIVTVRCIDAGGGPRYTCSIPGHRGFFSLDQFLWLSGSAPPDQEYQRRCEEEAQIKRERRLRKRAYDAEH